jgi:hypothetical protein
MYTRNSIRGLGRSRLGSVRKIVVSGLGCACQMKKTLGQDDVDDFPSFAPTGPSYAFGPNDSYTDNPVNVPAGYGYGPSPSGGVAIYPAGGATPGTPISAGASPSSGIVAVLNNPQTSPLSAGGSILTSSGPLAGSSTTILWVGGLGLLAVALVAMSGKGRR